MPIALNITTFNHILTQILKWNCTEAYIDSQLNEDNLMSTLLSNHVANINGVSDLFNVPVPVIVEHIANSILILKQKEKQQLNIN